MTDQEKINQYLSEKPTTPLPTKAGRGYKGTAHKKFKPKWTPKKTEDENAHAPIN